MDRFHEMQVFLAVAEEEGFAAAARRLKTSPPSVTRAIAAMEQRIGTQLLARTTRSLHLTEAGQRYLEDCRRILAELNEAEEAAAGSHGKQRRDQPGAYRLGHDEGAVLSGGGGGGGR